MDHNTRLRRQDRAINDNTWIVNFLRRAPFGVLATAHMGQPYAKPNLFVYDQEDHVIFFHGADEGRTLETLRENPQVCFTAAEMGRLLPAESVRGLSVEFASVVVFGSVQILEDKDEMVHGLKLLVDKYFSNGDLEKISSQIKYGNLPGTSVYRIDIQGWSGKQKKEKPDFPGAFTY